MRSHVPFKLLLLLSLSQRVVSTPRHDAPQRVLAPPSPPSVPSDGGNVHGEHVVDDAIWAALKANVDPVDALISLQPELAAQLAEPRLIVVAGQPEPEWMTEGDKLRLRREKKKFRDITDHQDLYKDSVTSWAGKASKCNPPPPPPCWASFRTPTRGFLFTHSTDWMLRSLTIQICQN